MDITTVSSASYCEINDLETRTPSINHAQHGLANGEAMVHTDAESTNAVPLGYRLPTACGTLNATELNRNHYQSLMDRVPVTYDVLHAAGHYMPLGDRPPDAYISLDNRSQAEDRSQNTAEMKRTSNQKKIALGAFFVALFLLLISLLVTVIFLARKDSCKGKVSVKNGQIVKQSGSNHGDTLDIRCNVGYELSGPSSATCLSSGLWSELPECKHIHCQRQHCQNPSPAVSTSCQDILQRSPSATSGAYQVTLWQSHKRIPVYCDMETDGGGWTVFQRRINGVTDFYRNFSEYESGFGNVNEEFWLGLKNIQEMVSQWTTTLRIDLQAADGSMAFETFSSFSLSNDTTYKLILGYVSCRLNVTGDAFRRDHVNAAFSTYDRDLDESGTNCAKDRHGAWWYRECPDYCVDTNLNGLYLIPGSFGNGTDRRGIVYESFRGAESLKNSKMMFRREKKFK